MKIIAPRKIDQLPGRRLMPSDRFSFRCHAGLVCFNQCCHNLNLFLYPYDVLRLKNSLGITADQFIETYVDIVLRPEQYFPEVLLRMASDKDKPCPFLTVQGCSVYPDRPDTCRTFPLEQGILFDTRTRRADPVFFYRPPDFCKGQCEDQTWTVSTWAKDQKAESHHRMTRRWAEIQRLFQSNPWGNEGPAGPRAKMAFMATYNMDRFRSFVFESTFFKRYRVNATVRKKIRTRDEALLLFGFDWIRLFLWGISSKTIRPR